MVVRPVVAGELLGLPALTVHHPDVVSALIGFHVGGPEGESHMLTVRADLGLRESLQGDQIVGIEGVGILSN
jgi:hypothetical protein